MAHTSSHNNMPHHRNDYGVMLRLTSADGTKRKIYAKRVLNVIPGKQISVTASDRFDDPSWLWVATVAIDASGRASVTSDGQVALYASTKVKVVEGKTRGQRARETRTYWI